MKVLFRTDASLEIGTGHVMRCLTLADALRRRGGECLFVYREHTGHLADLIYQRGYTAHPLSVDEDFKSKLLSAADQPPHLAWLGADWESDAKQTADLAQAVGVNLLVVDHYALDVRWEKQLRPHVKKIMVIDDIADRDHDCDLLLDQNLVADMERRYDTRVPVHIARLLGPQYALLQPEYAELHPLTPPRMGPVRRILVFFGGADQHNLTGLTLAAFLKLQRDDIALDVVINPQSPHAAAIHLQAQQHANFTVHDTLPSLAPLMLKADLAIGAGGATSWERCCLGLPTLVITLAGNQKPIAEELNQRSLVTWLGHYDTVTEDLLAEALQTVIEEPELKARSRACMEIVDGKGAEQVAAILSLNANTRLKARLARLEDEDLLLHWANDSLVRQNAFNPERIWPEAHRKWFYGRLRDPEHCRIYVIETEDGLPVGQVRFELTEAGWDIDYSMADLARGHGLGKGLMAIAMQEFRQTETGVLLFGRVKQDNKPSCTVFETLGFESDVCGGGGKLSIAVCSDRDSWINPSIAELLLQWIGIGHQCSWVHDADILLGGDLCFYLSYGKIVQQKIRSKYRNNLVVHESDLPKGKGWSPLSWQVLEGQNRIPVTLIEADDRVDSGPIYAQKWIEFEGHELIDELRNKQSDATLELCSAFVNEYPRSVQHATKQEGKESFYPRRRSADSRLNTNKTISEQFNLLRIVSNEDYPAFFELNGHRYVLQINKAGAA
jgi:UDP-2,4-diacetamido-2,4,6-trideoxy-beta-L-altropyranose hydrolase